MSGFRRHLRMAAASFTRKVVAIRAQQRNAAVLLSAARNVPQSISPSICDSCHAAAAHHTHLPKPELSMWSVPKTARGERKEAIAMAVAVAMYLCLYPCAFTLR